MTTVMFMLWVAALPGHDALQAQAGRVAGRIVDASTGTALPDAVVLLEPRGPGALSTPRADRTQAAVRQAVSDEQGQYLFVGLPRGAYVLRVERAGYRSRRVEIGLGSGGGPRLSVGLEVQPIPMEPLLVSAEAVAPSRIDPRVPEPPGHEESAAELRRARFLESDARLITGQDVGSSGSFPEPDLLRAIQGEPGISTRDEYAAELWTRGSPWGHTRVYLDDLPLFDPFFAAGTLTALAPSAVGGILLLPGARPVSVGEGAAGVVRLGTRPAEDVEGLPMMAELGLGTAHAMAERRFLEGRAGLLYSGRRSWFDQIWNTFVDDGFDPEGPFDYRAGSSLWRADAALGDRSSVVVSRYAGGDRVGGNAAALLTATRGRWENSINQAAVNFPLGSRVGRVSFGRSHYRADVGNAPEAFVEPLSPGVVVLRPASSEIDYRSLRIEATPRSRHGLSLGVDLVGQSLAATGVATAARAAGSTVPSTGSRDMGLLSAWGSYRTTLSPKLEVEGGLRTDAGSKVLDEGSVRFGPHLSLRFTPEAGTFVSLAGRRSFQYLQQVDAAGTRFGGGHAFGHVWALAGESVPVLATDIVSAGVERRLDAALWLFGNLWHRRSRGMTTRDPRVAAVPTVPVPWVVGENRATGVEVQLRKMGGPFTGRIGYAWTRSTDLASGETYASLADRSHMLDGIIAWRVRAGLQFNATFRAHSGSPYTRVLEDPCVDGLGRVNGCDPAGPWELRGPAGDARGPGYSTLDFGADWVRRNTTWGWGVSGRLRNVLGVDNRGGYRGTDCPSNFDPTGCVLGVGATDRFQRLVGFPLPTVSLRVWF